MNKQNFCTTCFGPRLCHAWLTASKVRLPFSPKKRRLLRPSYFCEKLQRPGSVSDESERQKFANKTDVMPATT